MVRSFHRRASSSVGATASAPQANAPWEPIASATMPHAALPSAMPPMNTLRYNARAAGANPSRYGLLRCDVECRQTQQPRGARDHDERHRDGGRVDDCQAEQRCRECERPDRDDRILIQSGPQRGKEGGGGDRADTKAREQEPESARTEAEHRGRVDREQGHEPRTGGREHARADKYPGERVREECVTRPGAHRSREPLRRPVDVVRLPTPADQYDDHRTERQRVQQEHEPRSRRGDEEATERRSESRDRG